MTWELLVSSTIFLIFSASHAQLFSGMAVAVPAFIVVLAWMRRHPVAGRMPRIIWFHGRSLLLISAVLNLLLVAWSLTSRKLVSSPDIVQLILSIYCLGYVALSPRLKDSFNSFPAAQGQQGQ